MMIHGLGHDSCKYLIKNVNRMLRIINNDNIEKFTISQTLHLKTLNEL